MENWGLITFSDSILIYDPKITHSERFQINARTVCHEVSHMWFGNLVTMDWWDDLWLNEGFARYSEHYVLDKLRSQYSIWSKYFSMIHETAMKIDSRLVCTHPIR